MFPVRHVASARVHVHERHQLGRHDDEGAHHVVVFVLEDAAVIHVAAAKDLEAESGVRISPDFLVFQTLSAWESAAARPRSFPLSGLVGGGELVSLSSRERGMKD